MKMETYVEMLIQHAVQDKVSMITPVPAGVGSVTTSILAKHVVKACKAQNNK